MEGTLPVGFRFHPTDEELVGYYLKHKLLGRDSLVHNVIAEVDVCKFEPWDLPGLSKVKSNDPQWYFFNKLSGKYANSNRCNRATKTGYWKVTGKNHKVKKSGTNNVIGIKKTLVFNMDGSPTNWVIHEFHALTFPEDRRNMVLCRLKNKPKKGAEEEEVDEGESSIHIDSYYENKVVHNLPAAMNPESIFPQAEEYDFSSTQQSPTAIAQGAFSANSPFLNAYCRNENNMHCPFETSTEEDAVKKSSEEEDEVNEFVNSILADEDIASTRECRVSKMAKSASCDSNVDKPLEINCSEISNSPYILRRLENQYDPTPDDFVSRRVAARRSQTQRKVRKPSSCSRKMEKLALTE
ncbi:hypothetical protein RIF29_16584 [Crotalaria pallida]|uniref:NAC domain-containing protein n=1 Tax=Crotalaria pallida TaxID=3830 RepID=A0AAN9IDR3_CROPI